MATKSATRDPAKERYWRQKLQAWQESGLSMAQFCKRQGLNAHTFSSWKYIIRERDQEGPGTAPELNGQMAAFARIELDEPELAELNSPPDQGWASGSVVTAELINAETGIKLRIFSGADQATLAAVLSAWSGR